MPDLMIRPRGPRVVAYGAAAVTIVFTVAMARALPDYVVFRPSEQVTMLLLLLAVLAILHGIGRSYVRADDRGIRIRNGYRTRDFTWDQVEGISMREGTPWPTLVTKQDERFMMFAIQRTDGHGAETVQRLREWIA